jgi:hypothetical protein
MGFHCLKGYVKLKRSRSRLYNLMKQMTNSDVLLVIIFMSTAKFTEVLQTMNINIINFLLAESLHESITTQSHYFIKY